MESHLRRISRVVILLCLFGGSVAASGQPDFAGVEIPGAHEAQCLLRITYTPASLPLDPGMLNTLVRSAGIKSTATHRFLGGDPRLTDMVDVLFELNQEATATARRSLGEGVMIGQLGVYLHDQEMPAKAGELLKAICARLQEALATAHEQQLESFQRRVEKSRVALEDARQRLARIHAVERELLERAGMPLIDRGSVNERIADAMTERENAQLDLAALSAREEAITRQIAMIGEKIHQMVVEDSITQELNKIVAIREQAVDFGKIQVEQGLVSNAEVANLQEALAKARVQLTQHQQEAAMRSGGDLLVGLNHQLVDINIEAAELRARLQHAEEKHARIQEANLLELAETYEREVELQLKIARRTVEELTFQVSELEEQLRSQEEPQLLVIGGL